MAEEMTGVTGLTSRDHRHTVLIASIITAAVVSAATAGYLVWRKTRVNRGAVDSVQDLLDKAHQTLHLLENRLDELRESVSLPLGSDTGTATA